MRARDLFHLWPRLHGEILGFLDLVPEGGLDARTPGSKMDLGDSFRHIASVEEYWLRVILGLERAQEKNGERSSGLEREISRRTCPDPAALRAILTSVFAETERLLDDAELDALAAMPVATGYPVANALEALSLCHLHTVHHRAQIVSMLRSLGVDPQDWV